MVLKFLFTFVVDFLNLVTNPIHTKLFFLTLVLAVSSGIVSASHLGDWSYGP
jgi:hypothetical protein